MEAVLEKAWWVKRVLALKLFLQLYPLFTVKTYMYAQVSLHNETPRDI